MSGQIVIHDQDIVSAFHEPLTPLRVRHMRPRSVARGCPLRRWSPRSCSRTPRVRGGRQDVGGWKLTCHHVPHAANADRYPTVAWKLTRSGRRLVYAPDVATPTSALREFARAAGLLIVDGATYRRRIFTHLRIDEDLPEICDWPVGRILLTQIGKSCPPMTSWGWW